MQMVVGLNFTDGKIHLIFLVDLFEKFIFVYFSKLWEESFILVYSLNGYDSGRLSKRDWNYGWPMRGFVIFYLKKHSGVFI